MPDKIFIQEAAPKVADLTITDLRQVVEEAVKEGVKAGCAACPIPEKARDHIGHMVGVIEDMGDGDIRKGVAITRDNMAYVAKDRKLRSMIFNWALYILIATGCSGLLWLVGMGIKAVARGTHGV